MAQSGRKSQRGLTLHISLPIFIHDYRLPVTKYMYLSSSGLCLTLGHLLTFSKNVFPDTARCQKRLITPADEEEWEEDDLRRKERFISTSVRSMFRLVKDLNLPLLVIQTYKYGYSTMYKFQCNKSLKAQIKYPIHSGVTE